MSSSPNNEPLRLSDDPEPEDFQFRLIHLLYATALIAAGLAAFGWVGGFVALGILAFWMKLLLAAERGFTAVETLVIAGIVLVLTALLLPAVQSAGRGSARRDQNMSNLKQIVLALHLYNARHGSFPPAYVPGPDGKPWHSWRVLILPFLEGEATYRKYRFDEPWDGPNNRLLAAEMPPLFASPYTDDQFRRTTSYLAILGPRTMWPGERGRGWKEMTDRSDLTLAAIEHRGSGIHWMEPRDLTQEEVVAILSATSAELVPAGSSDETRSYFYSVVYARIIATADGAIRSFGYQHDPSLAQAWCEIDDGRPVQELSPGATIRHLNWSNLYRLALFLFLALLPTPWAVRRYLPGVQ